MKRFYSGFGNPTHEALIAAAGMSTISHHDSDGYYERASLINAMTPMPTLPTEPEILGVDGLRII